MAIPPGTPSLLLTLLEGLQQNPSQYSNDPVIQQSIQQNISAVINALTPARRPNLIKDVAQKQLYETLYDIIEKEYEQPGMDPQNLVLNSAIGMALESAIKGASGSNPLTTLRDELRKKIIEALTPKKP